MIGLDRDESTTPFPRLGEIVRWLAGALDTRSSAPSFSKDLDRFAREESFDLTMGRDVLQRCVREPISKLSPLLADLLFSKTEQFLGAYVVLVRKIPVDALERKEVLELSSKSCFAPCAVDVLLKLTERLPGPRLIDLFDVDRRAVAVTFDWFLSELATAGSVTIEQAMRQVQVQYAQTPEAGRGRDAERDNAFHTVRDWRAGNRPSLGSITRLQQCIESVIKGRADSPEELSHAIAVWLVIARALDHADESSGFSDGVRSTMSRYLLAGCPSLDVGKILSQRNYERGRESMFTLKTSLIEACELTDPARTKDKDAGARAKQALHQLEEQWTNLRLPIGSRYMLHWRWARFLVLSNDLGRALEEYCDSFRFAAYRAGPNQEVILRELLIVAAYLRKKVTIRNHYRWAVAFGLFNANHSNRAPDPESWEIERLQKQFGECFPSHGHYSAADKPANGTSPACILVAPQRWMPDLGKPNRRWKKEGLRKPQLCWFALFNRLDAVSALLQKGANINDLSDANESALLLALGAASDGRGSQCAERLLQEPLHRPETLNAASQKKRATPLQYAIDAAQPNWVVRLLKLGADPNLCCDLDQMTPLYHTIQHLFFVSDPQEVLQKIEYMNPDPDALRRSSPSGGVFDKDLVDRLDVMKQHPRMPMIKRQLVEKEAARDPDALRKVVAALLTNGADPNQKQRHIGLSSMHFAAEVGDTELFRLLETHGGVRDSLCWGIAFRHARREMIEYLNSPP